ncbi:hypothetical protein [Vibrio crassostreae]|uniref:hypothetical protein n=1 Tax=Vibrio crassostreae TaxID=246167 RepID=UPI000F4A58C0|nr:hypothetical protein [Vibrio crassostreae]ROP14704.1 hypothetical protein EDB33_11560 [Vibrio crassostreae]ROP16174.1 hypothetical protein EDB34_11560 [Vibrio crassostreae]RPE90440.1 hypothetical protein EDB15_11540 [Vibrio crassostreae]TCV20887.1 hypothetical protein EDB11_11440 [Vibrio crassostreae]TCW15885.1 hypothetical protein EDB48_11342 [Vibrio crassostreae]
MKKPLRLFTGTFSTFTLSIFALIPFAFCVSAQEEPASDMADPMAVYTGGEIIAGNKGLGATFQFGVNRGDWGVLGKLEGKNNFENYRARFFTPNKKTGTGLFVDAGHDFSNDDLTSNYASIGVMQAFKLSDKFKLYSAITYGQMWEESNKFEDTQIISSINYLKYDFADQFYLLLAPQYTYGLDGENTRDFSAEMQLGYKVDSDNIIIFSGDTDNNTWITFRTRF